MEELLDAFKSMGRRLQDGEHIVVDLEESIPEEERQTLVVFLSLAAMAPVDIHPVAPGSTIYEYYIDHDRPTV